MDLTHFTPWSSLIGGALIGASASLLLFFDGRVAGISGIVGGLVTPLPGDTRWRGLFVAGLLLAGVCLRIVRPESFGAADVSVPVAIAAGLLVGFGTRLGGGCTSGHGVCGISRFSLRSIAATCTFMATGMAAAFVMKHLVQGAP